MVVLQTADGEGNHFDLALAELAAQSCSSAQLRGADRCVVSGVGEQDSPPRIKRRSEVRAFSLMPLASFKGGQAPLNAVVA